MDAQITEALAIVEARRPYLERYAAGLGLRDHDLDDCLSEARVAAWKAVKGFDPSRNGDLAARVVTIARQRMLDLRKYERRQRREPWRGRVGLEQITPPSVEGETVGIDVRDLAAAMSADSSTIVDLLCDGYQPKELASIGVPGEMIRAARDEAAAILIGGGNMKLRLYLEERAREINLRPPPQPDEADKELANRIFCAHKKPVRRLKIGAARKGVGDLDPPDVEPARAQSPATAGAVESAHECARNGCSNRAAVSSKFCGLDCAELVVQAYEKIPSRSRSVSHGEIRSGGFEGTASPEAVAALVNPFSERFAAHWVFELFRESALQPPGAEYDREKIIDLVVATCKQKGVALKTPRERVRRVVTETRAKGFELLKDDDGRLKLTGRRVKP